MKRRTALQSLWRATRHGIANFNRRLAEGGNPNDMVFHAPPPIRSLELDSERWFAEPRQTDELRGLFAASWKPIVPAGARERDRKPKAGGVGK